jgi:hypothetical protein
MNGPSVARRGVGPGEKRLFFLEFENRLSAKKIKSFFGSQFTILVTSYHPSFFTKVAI